MTSSEGLIHKCMLLLHLFFLFFSIGISINSKCSPLMLFKQVNIVILVSNFICKFLMYCTKIKNSLYNFFSTILTEALCKFVSKDFLYFIKKICILKEIDGIMTLYLLKILHTKICRYII